MFLTAKIVQTECNKKKKPKFFRFLLLRCRLSATNSSTWCCYSYARPWRWRQGGTVVSGSRRVIISSFFKEKQAHPFQ